MAIRPGSGPKNKPGPHDTFAAYGLAWANVSNTPLRGTKLTAYEGGIRTPLIVRWPRVIRDTGGLDPTVGHVIDMLPTCIDVAGVDYPSEFHGRRPLPVEGRSLAPVLRGEKREPHAMLCWSVPRHRAIRMGDWKLISAGPRNPWELYNLESDGTEMQNAAEKHPERVEEMAAAWEAWAERCGVKAHRRGS